MNGVGRETRGIGLNSIAPGELLPMLNIASADLLFHTASVTVVGTLKDMTRQLRQVHSCSSRYN